MTESAGETRVVVGNLEPGHAAKARHQFAGEARPQHVFFVRTAAGNTRAYRNVCPHMRAILDAGKGNFFDESGTRLICRVHGALFDPETGLCVEGPCQGESLSAVEFQIDGEEAIIG